MLHLKQTVNKTKLKNYKFSTSLSFNIVLLREVILCHLVDRCKHFRCTCYLCL